MRSINLDGTWKLRWADGQRGGSIVRFESAGEDPSLDFDAQVPGEVHLDLIRAGIIEEPAVGTNVLSCRWIEEMTWYFRRSFEAPTLAAGEKAFLCFDGLDCVGVVRLNGAEVGRSANAFLPCRFDVTSAMRTGENLVSVSIEAGLVSVSERPSVGYGMDTPPERTWDHRLHKRHWLRKTQSSFAWDWAPRLLNVGITGSVRLEICRTVRVEGITARSTLSENNRTGSVRVRTFVTVLDGTARPVALCASIEGTDARGQSQTELPAEDTGCLECTVELEHPHLWWPVGHGSQPLYSVRIEVKADGVIVASTSRRVAFRRVRVNQDPHPVEGRWFRFEINGKPIFAKGGNLVPADIILARLDADRYRSLVERALEANFNTLRVWGGGLYEADVLYDLCDELGVLVWQEFIFACAKYPVHDEAFLASVSAEARHQVRRLAHHASLVAWCGNNEMEEGAHYWGYEKGVAHPDYALFHLVLPRIVRDEDGSRHYQPSSPYSPDSVSPRDWHVGDQHPWTVGFANTDFRDYRKMSCRFPNEGGILGPTALPTVLACLPEHQKYPGSFAWRLHDNGVASWGDGRPFPDVMIEQWLGRSVGSMSVEDWVYWGGVVQGEGLTEYIRNFRRRMFDTASAIFWMYNDVWPAVRSWTIVDYYLRRTPAFWPVRRAFRPVITAIAVERDTVQFIVVNDGPAWKGELHFGLLSLTGGFPVDRQVVVEAPGNASTCVAEIDLAEWERLGETRHAAFAVLSRDGEEIARDRLFLRVFKEMEWPEAEVHVIRKGRKARFECDTYAWGVCLDLDGELALADNFFDVFPGIPTVLEWPDALGEPQVLRIANEAPRPTPPRSARGS
jgi:beta-mannosidase